MIDLNWKPKLTSNGKIAFDQDDDDEPVAKLSPAYGNRRRRQNQLVSRLKRRRNYPSPVRGGTGKQARSRRRKFS